MPLTLCIETSTKNCSVALSRDGEVLASKEQSDDQYIHSEKLHLFIREVLDAAGFKAADLDAVAVGKGPGSYTGLRIGISAAKGLCYTLQIPLLAIDGLSILAQDFIQRHHPAEGELILPMLDARRMEVYTALYDYRGNRQGEIEARILDESSFAELSSTAIHLIGDGATKAKTVLTDDRFQWHELPFPSAKTLARLVPAKLQNKEWEDVAYFEPFYLKDFVAGKPKKLL